MSSWVAPSVAAEIWGVSVEQVLAGIADGSIHSFVDGQFLFVDLNGNSSRRPDEQTPTQQVVTPEEFAALTYQPWYPEPEAYPSDETVEEAGSDSEEASAAGDVGSWRTARESSSRTRRPPAQAA